MSPPRTSADSAQCSPERPWGIHPAIRNDETCARCGWIAPGRRGDAIAAAEKLGWAVLAGGGKPAIGRKAAA